MAVPIAIPLPGETLTASDLLREVEQESGISRDSPDFAAYLDEHDSLASFRDQFNVPKDIYFGAHALGPAPKKALELLQQEADAWATVYFDSILLAVGMMSLKYTDAEARKAIPNIPTIGLGWQPMSAI